VSAPTVAVCPGCGGHQRVRPTPDHSRESELLCPRRDCRRVFALGDRVPRKHLRDFWCGVAGTEPAPRVRRTSPQWFAVGATS
jgi:hypothetical protein